MPLPHEDSDAMLAASDVSFVAGICTESNPCYEIVCPTCYPAMSDGICGQPAPPGIGLNAQVTMPSCSACVFFSSHNLRLIRFHELHRRQPQPRHRQLLRQQLLRPLRQRAQCQQLQCLYPKHLQSHPPFLNRRLVLRVCPAFPLRKPVLPASRSAQLRWHEKETLVVMPHYRPAPRGQYASVAVSIVALRGP